MTRDRSIVFFFCALVVAFVGANAASTSVGADASARWPVLRTVERPGAGGLRLIDVDAAKSSVARLPVVRVLRQLGNSARVALGQRLDWVFAGNAAHPSLFLLQDLWVASGLDAATREQMRTATSRAADYVALLQREGWTVVMVLVPPKMSVYPDWIDWPILAGDPLSRRPVPRDRSAEVIQGVTSALEGRGVRVVDLYSRYLAYRAMEPDGLLYPPAESHWGGRGLQVAAEETADAIARSTPIRRRFPRYATFDVRNLPDLFGAFDMHPWFPGPLAEFAGFNDSLVVGELGQPYFRDEQKQALVAVVGTSFSGRYTRYVGKPVGYASAVGNLLERVEIQSHARAGGGSGESIMSFLAKRAEVVRDFERRRALAPGSYPRVIVWEHPIRDILDLRGLPAAPSNAAPSAAVALENETPLTLDECSGCAAVTQAVGLFTLEKAGKASFRWAGPSVALKVTPQAAGTATLVLKLVAPFTKAPLTLVVEVNDAPAREVGFAGYDFASPSVVRIPVSMKAGVNTVRLRFPSSARAAFPGDTRQIAYGLVMPISIATR